MNDMLKRKWHSIYGQILFDRKLMAAWKQVKQIRDVVELIMKP